MSGFASWLGGQGGYLNPKLKPFIEVDDNGDRGVVAEEDIEEGQQLMLIPMSCCLHMPTQQEYSLSQVSEQSISAGVRKSWVANTQCRCHDCRQGIVLQSNI